MNQLTETEVSEIKRHLADGAPTRSIAQAYDIGLESVRRIARGDTWRWTPLAETVAPLPIEPPKAPKERNQKVAKPVTVTERFVAQHVEDIEVHQEDCACSVCLAIQQEPWLAIDPRLAAP